MNLTGSSELYDQDYPLNDTWDPCWDALGCFLEPCPPAGQGWTLQRLLLPPFYLAVFLLGSVTNGLVLAVLLRRRSRRRATDVFLLHLAAADLLLALSMPFWAAEEWWGWVFGWLPCKLVGALYNINFYSSIYVLVCISFERRLAVTQAVPGRHRGRPAAIWAASLAVWLICLLLAVPDFVYLHPVSSDGSLQCVHSYGAAQSQVWLVTLRCFYHATGFLLPVGAMTYCYLGIGRTILSSQGSRRRREWRAVRLMLAVVAAFLLCWTPHHGALLVETAHRLGALSRDCGFERHLDRAYMVTSCLGNLHCCLNPFLYAFVGLRFRGELWAALRDWGLLRGVRGWNRVGARGSRNSTVSGTKLFNSSGSWT
ncbi:C-X-C chemokine receptor type 3-like [Pristis pectinata]|uniref:C-X-C chemokine receptor type 3-like n=1 Tax=Pristis pectinata TaxID=685728 RepID=UPI00223CB562|nr:C-X-C chemokine receptor type 3-like [Pristis pectinata]